MHRFLFFLFGACMFAGWVQRTPGQRPGPGRINDLDAYFEEEPADNEMGFCGNLACKTRWTRFIPTMASLLEIPFSITGASSGKTTEVGVLLFVDGVAQPYSAVYEDGTELEESYMQGL